MQSGDRAALVLLAILAILPAVARGEENQHDQKQSSRATACVRAVDSFFAEEVWAKVGAQSCLTCHKPGGDAEESQLVLRDPERSQGSEKDEALRHNRDAFARIARLKEGEE